MIGLPLGPIWGGGNLAPAKTTAPGGLLTESPRSENPPLGPPPGTTGSTAPPLGSLRPITMGLGLFPASKMVSLIVICTVSEGGALGMFTP